MADPLPKELLRKLTGRKVLLSTRCGTFKMQSGTVKEVFDYFVLFVTIDEKFQDMPPIRHWVWADNIGVLTEEPRTAAADELQVTRYELG